MSQEELAERTSLRRTEIGLLERGVREPRLSTIIKLASALDLPAGELFDGIDWRLDCTQLGGFVLQGDDLQSN